MKTPVARLVSLAVFASTLLLTVSCAHAPRDPGAWKAASENAARAWIKTDPHLIARIGEVTTIETGQVEWDKVKPERVLLWRAPVHIRLANYVVDGPKGKFTLRIITQGRDNEAQVIYWAWSK